jgi:hypothetical protein
MATDGSHVLFGDSEDAGMGHPLAGDPTGAFVFFRSGSAENYGRMHLGWLWQGRHNSFQAGMNDQGLAYALTAVPKVQMNRHPERPFTHGQHSLYDWILSKAATVEEAVERTLEFDFAYCWFQIQYADATGDSLILSPGADGEFALTHRAADEEALVAATFNLSEPRQYIGRDNFIRHEQATNALHGLLEDGALNAKTFLATLQAIDLRGPYAFNRSYTVYSTTYDLTRLEATVYVLCLYDEPIRLDLGSELTKGDHRFALRDLLPPDSLRSAVRRYWAMQAGGFAGIGVGILAVFGAVLVGVRRLIQHRKESHNA